MVSENRLELPSLAAGRIARLRARADALNSRYRELALARPALGLPLVLYTRYLSRQGALLASAVAFRLYLWLMPLALLAAGVLAKVSDSDSGGLTHAARDAGVAGVASQQVVTALRAGHRSWWIAVIIGSVGFVWATRSLMRTVLTVNIHVWHGAIPSQLGRRSLISGAAFLGGWLVIGVLAAAVTHLDGVVAGGVVVATVVQAAGTATGWLAVSLTLPDARRRWTDLVPGSAVVGVSFAVLHVVSRVYLPRKLEHSSSLYGSLGIAAVILAWLLVIGEVIVGGALINSVWSDYRADRNAAK
jgi:uncharacterized BrkB/YihY/UPF0761 family membrane protein